MVFCDGCCTGTSSALHTCILRMCSSCGAGCLVLACMYERLTVLVLLLPQVLSEGGAPLSAGQKQLVALARALLRHSKARTIPIPPLLIQPAYHTCMHARSAVTNNVGARGLGELFPSFCWFMGSNTRAPRQDHVSVLRVAAAHASCLAGGVRGVRGKVHCPVHGACVGLGCQSGLLPAVLTLETPAHVRCRSWSWTRRPRMWMWRRTR
jgi:hypothetical protein